MTEDVFAEMLEDATKAPEVPSDEKLSGVAALVEKQIVLEDRIANGEELLKQLKKELKEIQLGSLPAALDELGLSGLPMNDGSEVIVKPFISASISKDNKEQAYAWLTKNGHADLIKHTISANVGKDPAAAAQVATALNELGFEPQDVEKVEPMTLKAFIKEQVAAGAPIPLELFGAYLGQKATIKRRK